MTTAEKLLRRLRAAGLDLPEGSRLVRVYPSAAMRNEGSWSWAALGPRGEDLRIGSQFPMGQLLAAGALHIAPITSGAIGDDTEISPAEPCRNCESAAPTRCRICGTSLCPTCFTDHHHEGYGTSAEATW